MRLEFNEDTCEAPYLGKLNFINYGIFHFHKEGDRGESKCFKTFLLFLGNSKYKLLIQNIVKLV